MTRVAIAILSAWALITSGAGAFYQSGAPDAHQLRFTDITAKAGIRFRHTSGAFGKKYLPETMGSGAAFLDVDNDGWQDIFLVNSTHWPGHKGPATLPALYRNTGTGTFTNITRQAGLDVEMYGLGAAAADYDNDGDVDLYVTALGPNRLFRNTGGGTFEDVTQKAGVGDPGFSTSAAWFDYDRDGLLDLFVANYVQWTIDTDLRCTLDGRKKSYCTPESYKGQSGTLYRNRGDGTFEDRTRQAGLHDPAAKALGVAILDYNADGRIDLFVANDTQPNRLYRNNADGTFTDVGMMAGVAFNEAGVARAGMGVDAADYNGSGRPGILIGNFSNEMMTLYANEGTGLFIDDAPTAGIGRESLLTLTFACFFFDGDLDGWLDIFAANGHVSDDIATVQPKVTYAQPPHLFRNVGAGKFTEISDEVGADFQRPIVGRGAAYADIDHDGDLDLLVTTSNGPARLLRNDRANRNRALRVVARGTRSNRDGIGATIRVTLDSGTSRSRMVKTGSSYLSQSELPVTFGLGPSGRVTALEIAWPSGQVDRIKTSAASQAITVEEGKGIVRTVPIGPGGSARR